MKDKTSIICILDRSGSMSYLVNDAIGGFNTFLKEQKAISGEAEMTIALFDDKYDVLANGENIQEIEPLNAKTYVPRGMTALYDAIGKTINEAGTRFSAMPESERPNKVICVILTDGEENSSHEFTREKIFEMTKVQQEKYNWEFIYLGSNQDAMAVGGSIGVNVNNCVNYAASGIGTADAYSTTSRCVASYRATGKTQVNDSGSDDGIIQ